MKKTRNKQANIEEAGVNVSSQRPNILYIRSHDTGRYIQPYGYGVSTPNMQRFAEQGVLFRNAFCAAPTCSPSRAALRTGQYPHKSRRKKQPRSQGAGTCGRIADKIGRMACHGQRALPDLQSGLGSQTFQPIGRKSTMSSLTFLNGKKKRHHPLQRSSAACRIEGGRVECR